jgi:hypothetical protein
MGKLLKNKSEIMQYTDFGEHLLDNLAGQYNFPHFKLGNRWLSNTDAIDQWSYEFSMGNIDIPENKKT